MKRVILSCGALAKELRHLTSHQASMDALVFVPPSQHLDPTRLRTELVRRLTLLKKKYEQIFVVFGLCLPDMDQYWPVLTLNAFGESTASRSQAVSYSGGS